MTRPARPPRSRPRLARVLASALATVALIAAGAFVAAPAQAFSDPQGSITLTCSQGGIEERTSVTATLDEGETPPVVQKLVNGNVSRTDVLGDDGTWTGFAAGMLAPGVYVYTLTLGGSVVAEESFNMPSDCPEGGNSPYQISTQTTCVDGIANVSITIQPPLGATGAPVGYKASTYNYETFEHQAFGEPQTVSAAGQTIEFADTRAPGTYDVDITTVIQGPVGGSHSALFHVPSCGPSPVSPEVTGWTVGAACVADNEPALVTADVTVYNPDGRDIRFDNPEGERDINVFNLYNDDPSDPNLVILDPVGVESIGGGSFVYRFADSYPYPPGPLPLVLSFFGTGVGQKDTTVPDCAAPAPEPSPTETGVPSPSPAEDGTPGITLSSPVASPGERITVTASGFAAGEELQLWFHSTPVRLDTATASSDGTLVRTVTIPEDAATGAHRIEVRGTTSGSAYANLTVAGDLAATGADGLQPGIAALGGVLLLGGIGLTAFAVRRRMTRA
jgi:hypothetical protein